MAKVNINTCTYQDLRQLPGIGQTIADRIWDLRKLGEITPEEFAKIPKLRVTAELLNHLDFDTNILSDHEDVKPSDDRDNYYPQSGSPSDEVQDYEEHGSIKTQEIDDIKK